MKQIEAAEREMLQAERLMAAEPQVSAVEREVLQVTGVTTVQDIQPKQLSVAKVRKFFRDIAKMIPQDAEIIGSADASNPYEVLTSFAFNGCVIALSLTKGGVL